MIEIQVRESFNINDLGKENVTGGHGAGKIN